MKRILLLTAGSICLLLGGIGVFLPLLPTTPFVLLAAICFSYSNDKAYQWLLKNRTFGPYIENYKTGCGVPRRTKIRALCWLWATMALCIFLVSPLYLRILLACIATGVSIHLLSIKTQK